MSEEQVGKDWMALLEEHRRKFWALSNLHRRLCETGLLEDLVGTDAHRDILEAVEAGRPFALVRRGDECYAVTLEVK